jgi:hypothetical protein
MGTNKNVVRGGFLLQAEPLEWESTVLIFATVSNCKRDSENPPELNYQS